MLKFKVSVLCLFLYFLTSYSQTVLKNKKIQFIDTSWVYPIFYGFKKQGLYKINLKDSVIYVDSTENTDGIEIENSLTSLYFEKFIDGSFYEIEKARNFIAKNKIVKFDFKSEFKEKKYERVDGNLKSVLSIFNSNLLMVEYYIYREVNQKFEWKFDEADIFNTFYIDLGNDKKILLLDKNKGYIIPTKEKLIIKIDENDYSNATKIEYIDSNLTNVLKRSFQFYFKQKVNYNKWILKNKFDKQVLNNSYDSIFKNNNFIIGISKNKYEIYNSRLDLLFKNQIPCAYPMGFRLQILNGNKISIIDCYGKDASQKKEIFSVCGTVTYYQNFLTRDSLILSSNDMSQVVKEKKYSIKHLNADSISFFNNKNTLEYDDNFFHNPDKYLFQNFYKSKDVIQYNLLLILKNKKFGIYQFNIKNDSLNLKELLPIEYDSIIYQSFFRPMKLKKDGLYTYFLVNKVKYKSLGKFEGYFCRYEKINGEIGWLDFKGNEFPD